MRGARGFGGWQPSWGRVSRVGGQTPLRLGAWQCPLVRQGAGGSWFWDGEQQHLGLTLGFVAEPEDRRQAVAGWGPELEGIPARGPGCQQICHRAGEGPCGGPPGPAVRGVASPSCRPRDGFSSLPLLPQKLEYTMGGDSSDTPSCKELTSEELCKQMDKLLKENPNNQRIYDWIEVRAAGGMPGGHPGARWWLGPLLHPPSHPSRRPT